eukprot:CAMPEP_0181347550 /NCGR_PEP_ID=MMETSP1101-20121128/33938_1 /TAXON_ID=46948 /ORGANISM="Rhodomonas abbreviata, Strain Caron Lab Isolate" /LENGTH=285 /DNA_ID=CAMNT_0023459771 /DNA_START=189 /DNA_END=1047 /DNA_ORIENTATION=+
MATAEPQALEYEVDDRGRERLKYREEGWNTWVWKGTEETTCAPYEINYVQGGEAGVPIVLVHGFGAHAYHWRYQFPELAKKHKVYSLCLLGYGWSPKAVVPYSMDIWGQQVADFIAEVVQEPAVVVETPSEEKKKGLGGWLASAFQKIASGLIFLSTKSRIGPILKQVYHDEQQVDDDLVRSIQTPAKDPQALAAFREISMQQARIRTTVPEMLDLCKEQLPVLILWGQKDPWMTPARGDSVNRVCEEKGLECEFIPLEAGHCPQDDNPDAVNKELLKWVADRFE